MGSTAQRALRLLARNAFLIDSVAARLKIPGDHNAWAELAVDDQANLFVIEIEPGVDVLDALRRVLAGSAIVISRYGVLKSDLNQAIVLVRLPNERVDLYRVIEDVENRLGIQTFMVPLALLLLNIRAGGLGLAGLVEELCHLKDGSLLKNVERRFGKIRAGAQAGLSIGK